MNKNDESTNKTFFMNNTSEVTSPGNKSSKYSYDTKPSHKDDDICQLWKRIKCLLHLSGMLKSDRK